MQNRIAIFVLTVKIRIFDKLKYVLVTYPGIKNLKCFSNMSNATKRPLITHDGPSKLLLVSKKTIPENKNAPLKSSIAEISKLFLCVCCKYVNLNVL